MDGSNLRRRVEELLGRPLAAPPPVVTDTTQFMNIWRGHVIRLDDRHFVVERDMKEGRFGLDEEPKFWVKGCRDLDTGASKILKLVFNEEFDIRVGLLRIHCYRDPEKEGRVLDRVRGDGRFMQGETLEDDGGNPVRVIDFIRGKNLYRRLRDLEMEHEVYFHTELPGILRRLLPLFEGIAMMHREALCHGDIRNDHVIIEAGTGRFRWIDFDLCQDVSDFDVWSLGNILVYVIGKGERTFHDLRAGRLHSVRELVAGDASAFFVHRIMNLRKLFPWIPPELNEILMHFSYGTRDFYESAEEILSDLRPVVDALDPAVRTAGEGGAS